MTPSCVSHRSYCLFYFKSPLGYGPGSSKISSSRRNSFSFKRHFVVAFVRRSFGCFIKCHLFRYLEPDCYYCSSDSCFLSLVIRSRLKVLAMNCYYLCCFVVGFCYQVVFHLCLLLDHSLDFLGFSYYLSYWLMGMACPYCLCVELEKESFRGWNAFLVIYLHRKSSFGL